MRTEKGTSTGADLSLIEQVAGEWALRAADGDLSTEDQAELEAWLNADPLHREIYSQQRETWALLPQMQTLEDYDRLMAPGTAERLQSSIRGALAKPVLGPALGAAVAVCLALFVIVNVTGLDAPVDTVTLHATEVAEIRDVTLEDGSVVTLGAASGFDVVFSPTERRVVLTAGEAFFDVKKNAARPFFVEAGDAVVRVVGTKFDVHLGAEDVRVSVLEGVVEVLKSNVEREDMTAPEDTRRVLTAGQRTVAFRRGDITPVETVDTEEVAAWRAGRLVYVGARLEDIIADMKRYYPNDIVLAGTDLNDIEFTASFRTDQIDRMIEIMAMSLSLDAEKDSTGRIVLKPAQGG